MKRYLSILVLFLFVLSSFGQNSRVIYVSVTSECINEKELHIIEDMLQDALLEKQITVRTFQKDGEFAAARIDELLFQESGNVSYEDIKSSQKMFAADELMVVAVEKLSGEYYFRARLFDLETARLIKTARYPDYADKTDKQLKKINNIKQLGIVAGKLIIRLGI